MREEQRGKDEQIQGGDLEPDISKGTWAVLHCWKIMWQIAYSRCSINICLDKHRKETDWKYIKLFITLKLEIGDKGGGI